MAQAAEDLDGDGGESYECRFDGCGSTFDSTRGRGVHEGLKHDQQERLLDDLRSFAKELGRTPTTDDMNDSESVPTAMTYHNHFGSWNDALDAAGLELNCEPSDRNRDELIEDLRQLADELNRTPTIDHVDECESMASSNFYQNHFGSWNGALDAAGLDLNLERTEKSRAELLDDLRSFADELGRSPKRTEVDQNDEMASGDHYHVRFDSWNGALEEAGLEPNRDPVDKDRRELLEDLRSLADELGHTPTTTEVDDSEGVASNVTYWSHFGTFNQALKAAGLDLNRQWHDESSSFSSRFVGSDWKEHRLKTLDRDNNECQICGSEETSYGSELHVHHITPRFEYWDDDSLDWEHVNDLRNLITLCDYCHPRVEGKFTDADPDTFAELGQEYLGVE